MRPLLDPVSEETLRTADRILLVDADRPGWQQPLYSSLLLRSINTLEIRATGAPFRNGMTASAR